MKKFSWQDHISSQCPIYLDCGLLSDWLAAAPSLGLSLSGRREEPPHMWREEGGGSVWGSVLTMSTHDTQWCPLSPAWSHIQDTTNLIQRHPSLSGEFCIELCCYIVLAWVVYKTTPDQLCNLTCEKWRVEPRQQCLCHLLKGVHTGKNQADKDSDIWWRLQFMNWTITIRVPTADRNIANNYLVGF